MEIGETALATILREIMEEVHIRMDSSHLLYLGTSETEGGEWVSHVFCAIAPVEVLKMKGVEVYPVDSLESFVAGKPWQPWVERHLAFLAQKFHSAMMLYCAYAMSVDSPSLHLPLPLSPCNLEFSYKDAKGFNCLSEYMPQYEKKIRRTAEKMSQERGAPLAEMFEELASFWWVDPEWAPRKAVLQRGHPVTEAEGREFFEEVSKISLSRYRTARVTPTRLGEIMQIMGYEMTARTSKKLAARLYDWHVVTKVIDHNDQGGMSYMLTIPSSSVAGYHRALVAYQNIAQRSQDKAFKPIKEENVVEWCDGGMSSSSAQKRY